MSDYILKVFHPTGRRTVPAIEKSMDYDIVHLHLGAEFQQRVEMFRRRMHQAIGDQSHDMQFALFHLCRADLLDENGIFEKYPLGNHLINARHFLVDDSSRAQVEMPDLGVAHLPLWKTDS